MIKTNNIKMYSTSYNVNGTNAKKLRMNFLRDYK